MDYFWPLIIVILGTFVTIWIGIWRFSKTKVNMRPHHKIEAIAIVGLVVIALVCIIIGKFFDSFQDLLTLAGVAVGGITGFLAHKMPRPNKTNVLPIDDKEVTVGGTLTFTVQAINNLNFTLTYSMMSKPELKGEANLNTNTGDFEFKPTEEETYEVTFTATDGQGGTDSKTVRIVVKPQTQNNQPTTAGPE